MAEFSIIAVVTVVATISCIIVGYLLARTSEAPQLSRMSTLQDRAERAEREVEELRNALEQVQERSLDRITVLRELTHTEDEVQDG